MSESEQHIADQLERTNKLIERLENHRYLQMVDRPWRFLFMSFLQGIAIALGSTAGFALVVALVAYILQKLQIIAPLESLVGNLQILLQNAGQLSN